MSSMMASSFCWSPCDSAASCSVSRTFSSSCLSRRSSAPPPPPPPEEEGRPTPSQSRDSRTTIELGFTAPTISSYLSLYFHPANAPTAVVSTVFVNPNPRNDIISISLESELGPLLRPPSSSRPAVSCYRCGSRSGSPRRDGRVRDDLAMGVRA
jgi:hypothetical protein